MYSQQLKVNRIVGIVHTVLAILVNSSNAQVSLSFESSCHYAGDTLVLVAQYSGGSTVNSIDWYFDKQTAANIVVMASTCSVFGGADAGYPNSRMSYSCDTGTNTYKATISNLDGTEVGEWGVILTFNDFTTTTIVKTTVSLCTECNVTSVQNGAVNSTQSTVRQDTVIGIKCDAGYTIDGSSALTCQSDGTWDKQWPTCPRITTTSSATTTAAPTETPVPPESVTCEYILCFILLILTVVFVILFVGIHGNLIWKQHDWAINEISKSDYGKKACLPAGCVCCILVLIQFLIFYLAVEGCDYPLYLILPIILMVLIVVAAVGLIGGFVHHRGTKTSGRAVKQEGSNKKGPGDAEELRPQKPQDGKANGERTKM